MFLRYRRQAAPRLPQAFRILRADRQIGLNYAAISMPATAPAVMRPAILLGTSAISKACSRLERSEQECKRRFAAILDLEREEIIRPGASQIDGSDRDLPVRRHLRKAEAGIDH